MAAVPVVYENNTHRVGTLAELGILSTSESNMLSFDTSGGIYLDASAIISNSESQNLITSSLGDRRLFVAPSTLRAAGFIDDVSHNAGNLLALGTDGGPLLTIAALTEAGLVKQTGLSSILNELGYVTSATVTTLLANAGYVTRSELSSANYATRSELAGYVTTATLATYPTRSEVSSMISQAGGGGSSTVSPSDLVATDSDNALTIRNGKLYVASTVVPDSLVAKATASGGNLLTTDDNGLLIVPNDCGELD